MTDTPTGYSPIPDGLWTCDLSHGAARVIGWMWTLSDDHFTPDEVREVFGGAALSWLAELTMAGFLDPHETSGDRLSYEVVTKAWEALA